MKNLLSVLLALAATSAQAQTFIPTEKGTVLEYKYYDARGRAVRDKWRNEKWLRFTVEQVWRDSTGTVVNVGVENETFARLARNIMLESAVADLAYGDVRVTDDSVAFENMQWHFTGLPWFFDDFPAEMPKDYNEDGDMSTWRATLSATVRLPLTMRVGDTLPDARFDALFEEQLPEKEQAARDEDNREFEEEMRMEGAVDFTMPRRLNFSVVATVHGRRVEAVESVETPAGAFECYKISYRLTGPKHELVGLPAMFRNGGTDGFAEVSDGGGGDGFTLDLAGGPVVATIKYVDWLSPEVGLVKREKYNGTGRRVEETMVLGKIIE